MIKRGYIFEWLLASILIGCVLLCVLCSLTGCKTCVPIVETRDSIRVEYKLDSVYVYQHDSIFRDRWRNGDTVFVTVEKWQTRYKDKIVQVHDTIATSVTDTIQVEVIPKFYRGCTIAMWIIIACLVIGIVARILIKVYLHK